MLFSVILGSGFYNVLQCTLAIAVAVAGGKLFLIMFRAVQRV